MIHFAKLRTVAGARVRRLFRWFRRKPDEDEAGEALVGARLNPKPHPRRSSVRLPEPD